MAESEFSLIDHYFKHCPVQRDDVILGIGDDAAITRVAPGMQLVSAVDTLVDKVHFPEDTTPDAIGYKSLAVNLSDLAAMGAEPAWATLAITMPQADAGWIKLFCDGFFQLAKQFNVQLIGGDTTQGPLTVSVQIMGLVPEGTALTRGGASVNDRIFVTGTLGDAALGLAIKQGKLSSPALSDNEKQALMQKLDYPVPRLQFGSALRSIATAAIDISDGLAADLNHILATSQCGATINWQQLPLSPSMQSACEDESRFNYVLGGGDDYELCFTVPEEKCSAVLAIAKQLNLTVSEIGVIEAQPGLRLQKDDALIELQGIGFEHFSIC